MGQVLSCGFIVKDILRQTRLPGMSQGPWDKCWWRVCKWRLVLWISSIRLWQAMLRWRAWDLQEKPFKFFLAKWSQTWVNFSNGSLLCIQQQFWDSWVLDPIPLWRMLCFRRGCWICNRTYQGYQIWWELQWEYYQCFKKQLAWQNCQMHDDCLINELFESEKWVLGFVW